MYTRRFQYYILFYGFLILVFLSCKQGERIDKKDEIATTESSTLPLFTLLPPEHTHVLFENTLTESLNANVLMYEYLYNGGGVATGDFNQDGLMDIYFISNMGENKFYINLGDMKFQDATAISKVSGRPGPWKTGVTAVDINGDGKLDLYVCYSGALPPEKRRNQLFINQGNDQNNVPIFEEKATQYGLDSPAFSNQGYFFDYDHDGDLDMLLLNHNPKSLPVLNEVSTKEYLKKDDPLQGIRLFEQTNGHFKDVTKKAGISGSALTYGLGLGISDLNNDGWVDFYVSNDYTIPDYLYINNKNGTFTDKLQESLGHTSHFSMGNDVADINNDGWQDIITLDMLPEDNRRQKLLLSPDNYEKFDLNLRSGFYYQYMRNMLQLNNGNGSFSEIGQLAGISNTDWSWAALLADFNNDGWKDLFVSNGYYRDYTNLDFINYMENYVKSKGRLKREDVLDIIKEMPSSNLTNYMFVNTHGTTFKNETKAYGLDQPANSNGAAYVDLDNDGDLDLVVNNINKPAFIYRNEAQETGNHYLQVKLKGTGLNPEGIGSKVTLFNKGQRQGLEQMPTKGYLSTVSPILNFGLAKEDTIDSLVIQWNSGKSQTLQNINVDALLVLDEMNAKVSKKVPVVSEPIFKRIPSPIAYKNEDLGANDFKRQSLLIEQLSHSGPCLVKGDINKDGLEDVFIGGAKNEPAAIFLQQKNQGFKRIAILAFENDKAYEDADAVIFDANGDGNPDIYVASGGYHNLDAKDPLLQDRLYLGTGTGNFIKSQGAIPPTASSKGCVVVNDINNDGSPDLFVGGRVVPGRYPEVPQSFVLLNDGKGIFSDQTARIAPELENFGMITDAQWADMNGDGIKDLILVGDWLPISIFINKDGKLQNETLTYFDTPYSGWWNTLEVADFNTDGKLDIIAGNMGINTQFKVSDSEPAELYYDDFDQNGSVDPLLTYFIQGKSYPNLTRDELLGQLSKLRQKFNSYKSYADATINDILTEEELKKSRKLKATKMETSLFLGTQNGSFEIAQLPIQAQYAPVNEIILSDFNADGQTDMLLFGNNFYFKLKLGKFDANYGTLLLGNGHGEFDYMDQNLSGLDVRGAVKSGVLINDLLLLGINGEVVQSYKVKKSPIKKVL